MTSKRKGKMLRQLQNDKNELEKLLVKIRKQCKSLPEGKLSVSSSHGCSQFSCNGKYLPKSKKKLIEALAMREYYEKLEKRIAENLPVIEKAIRVYGEKGIDCVYDSLPRGKQSLINNALYVSLTQRVEEFENMQFESYESEYAITSDLYTDKGEHVRSKSEKIIADELYRRNIPYHYEMPLVLFDRGRKIVFHPDITAMNRRTGKIRYIEHLGLMDNIKYVQNAMGKITLYEKNSILLGRDLLLFHEGSDEVINTKVLLEYIEEYLI